MIGVLDDLADFCRRVPRRAAGPYTVLGFAMGKNPIRILFLQTATDWAPRRAASGVQHLVVSNLDRREFDVHVACSVGPQGQPTEPYIHYQKTPDIHLRPTKFGLRIFESTKRDAVK